MNKHRSSKKQAKSLVRSFYTSPSSAHHKNSKIKIVLAEEQDPAQEAYYLIRLLDNSG